MRMQRLGLLGVLCCGMGLALVLCGCDSGPDTSEVTGYFDSNEYESLPRENLHTITLVVSPSAAELEYDGAKIKLKASGGQAPYWWEVVDISLGSIIGTGPTVVYQRDAVGDNVVILHDNAGAVAYCIIAQPEVIVIL